MKLQQQMMQTQMTTLQNSMNAIFVAAGVLKSTICWRRTGDWRKSLAKRDWMRIHLKMMMMWRWSTTLGFRVLWFWFVCWHNFFPACHRLAKNSQLFRYFFQHWCIKVRDVMSVTSMWQRKVSFLINYYLGTCCWQIVDLMSETVLDSCVQKWK